MNKKKLFRKVSLERLSSPEQLDRLIEITSLKGWVALIGLGIIVVMVVLWGIYGSIPTKVSGSGILIRKSGLSTIYSSYSGIVSDVYVNIGEQIKRGELIAKITREEFLSNIEENEEDIEDAKNKYRYYQIKGKQDLDLQLEIYKDKKNELKQDLIALVKNKNNLERQLRNYNSLYNEGLLTKQKVIELRQKLNSIINQIEVTKNSIMHQNIEAFKYKQTYEQKLEDLRYAVIIAQQKLKILKAKIKQESEIKSTFNGKIVELSIEKGGSLQTSSTVLTVENSTQGKNLYAVFFVPAVMGKHIKNNMEAQISPTITKREEFGFIRSKIISVSEFPITKEGMRNIIDNEQLVSRFIQLNTPLVVYAKLSEDSNTFSGYNWSSSKGPEIKIATGTLCNALVVVKTQPPITLVIPALKNLLGI